MIRTSCRQSTWKEKNRRRLFFNDGPDSATAAATEGAEAAAETDAGTEAAAPLDEKGAMDENENDSFAELDKTGMALEWQLWSLANSEGVKLDPPTEAVDGEGASAQLESQLAGMASSQGAHENIYAQPEAAPSAATERTPWAQAAVAEESSQSPYDYTPPKAEESPTPAASETSEEAKSEEGGEKAEDEKKVEDAKEKEGSSGMKEMVKKFGEFAKLFKDILGPLWEAVMKGDMEALETAGEIVEGVTKKGVEATMEGVKEDTEGIKDALRGKPLDRLFQLKGDTTGEGMAKLFREASENWKPEREGDKNPFLKTPEYPGLMGPGIRNGIEEGLKINVDSLVADESGGTVMAFEKGGRNYKANFSQDSAGNWILELSQSNGQEEFPITAEGGFPLQSMDMASVEAVLRELTRPAPAPAGEPASGEAPAPSGQDAPAA